MVNLSTVFAGLNLRNPIIIASSGLTDSTDKIIELERAGAAAVVIKSLFEEEILLEINASLKQMSSDGFLYPETVEFYEDHVISEDVSQNYLNQIRKAKQNINIPVIASINCISASHWTYYPREIQLANADALELNIFILPSDFKRKAEENERMYFEIINEVKKQVSIPVIVKLSYYFSNLSSFLQKISNTGIDGLVLFNRYYNPDIDIDTLEFTSGGVLSSPSDYYNSLRWIGILSGRTGCSLAASTGIHDEKSLIKLILAGANAVEIASTIYLNGNNKIKVMLNYLEKWMVRKKMKSIEDFRGIMSQAKIDNPASFERVQFMKYFRGFQNS